MGAVSYRTRARRYGGETLKTVTEHLSQAFTLAMSQYAGLRNEWLGLSMQMGGKLPRSLIVVSVQQIGDMDLLLRALEDERLLTADNGSASFVLAGHYQVMLSGLWIGASYDVLNFIQRRKLTVADSEFLSLARDIERVRVQIDKHEIAHEKHLRAPLEMQRWPLKGDETDRYEYSPNDRTRTHIPRIGLSSRGSIAWEVIEAKSGRSYWVERRDTSERILKLWANGPATA